MVSESTGRSLAGCFCSGILRVMTSPSGSDSSSGFFFTRRKFPPWPVLVSAREGTGVFVFRRVLFFLVLQGVFRLCFSGRDKLAESPRVSFGWCISAQAGMKFRLRARIEVCVQAEVQHPRQREGPRPDELLA